MKLMILPVVLLTMFFYNYGKIEPRYSIQLVVLTFYKPSALRFSEEVSLHIALYPLTKLLS